MDKFLDNKQYLIIRLVGNQYCTKTPSSKDTKLRFKYEKDNLYDHNAIKVYSIRDGNSIDLGYIEKGKNVYLKSLIKQKSVKYKMIIKKLEYDEIYYYIVFKFRHIANV